ncbi:acyltransferase [Leucothrix sargassi]|nr:acyltransferase [Leucothrix sargassi]
MQIHQITFTRFIAALTVVFFHYGPTAFPASLSWIHESVTAGPVAVNYFYVLSGFIMAIAYYQLQPTKVLSKKRYWLARFARIYPVYLVALLLMAVAGAKELIENPLAFPLHLTMLQAWIPGYPMTLNNPGWSLSVEAFFYLSFPFLLALIYKTGLKYLSVLCVILWVATQYILIAGINSDSYVPAGLLHDFVYYHPLMHINAFIAGLVCGVLFKRNAEKLKPTNTYLLIASVLLIIVLLETRPLLEASLGIKLAYTNGLIAPAFLLFIWLLASAQGCVARVLSHPVLILLGEASFSLYILQKPVFGLYNKLIEPRLGLSAIADFYSTLIILIVVSILSYKLFETPLRTYINKKLS